MTFKRALIIGALSLLGSSLAQAQTVTFGPEVGVSFNNFIHNESNQKSDFIVGLKAGMNFNFPIGSRSFINLGAFYHQRGGRLDRPSDNSYSLLQVEHITVPFMFIHRIKLNSGRAGSIYAGLGPYLAYGFEGRYKEYQNTSAGKTEIQNRRLVWGNDLNEVRRIEYGISGAVRYEFPFNYYIKAQYSNGFSNIYNSEHNKLRLQSIQLTVGFNFWTWIK